MTLGRWPFNVAPLERPAALNPSGLPVYASRFIGREHQIAELSKLIGKRRLITLSGPPGSGKTRLGVEVAGRMASNKPDGATLVELAALREGERLPETIAAALGIRVAPTGSALDAVIDHLRDTQGLLVVDNCEHLVEAAANAVDRVLRRCHGLIVLATSREPLRIDGETVWRVAPLALPRDGASIVEIRRSEAVRLFVDRARQAATSFELTRSNATKIASICHRLDGLPLALEIAAARCSALELESISEQLDDRFRFLTSGFRNAPARQRTLRAAIDWSYGLLTGAEGQLLMRAAVFAGSFDRPAAESVCAGGAVLRSHVADLLSRLIEKSLVNRLMVGSDQPRYRLLESLRAYGLDRLRESDELEPMQRAHAEYFAVVVDDRHEEKAQWLDLVRVEVDNVREALTWSRRADHALHLRLAVSMGVFCVRAGFVGEGTAWLEPALAFSVDDKRLVARANEVAAYLAWRQDDFQAAERFASSAVEAARSLDDGFVAQQLGVQAFIRLGARQFELARQAVDELTAIAKRNSDRTAEAMALCYLGLIEAHGPNLAQARDLLSRSIELLDGEGKPDQAATSCNGLGWVYLRLHQVEQARPVIQRALKTRMRHGDMADMGGSLDSSAELAFMEAMPERAMRLKGAADGLRESLGTRPPSLSAESRSRWVHLAEKALGKMAHAMWLEGRKLTFKEGAAYALSSPSRLPPRPVRDLEDLTSREMQVAGLVADGLTNEEIASRLKLSRRTIEAHLDHIRDKLGARSRVEVATWVTARSTPLPASGVLNATPTSMRRTWPRTRRWPT